MNIVVDTAYVLNIWQLKCHQKLVDMRRQQNSSSCRQKLEPCTYAKLHIEIGIKSESYICQPGRHDRTIQYVSRQNNHRFFESFLLGYNQMSKIKIQDKRFLFKKHLRYSIITTRTISKQMCTKRYCLIVCCLTAV